MTITEKVAYLKGLTEGLDLDDQKKETRVIRAMLDILDELASSLTDCEDDIISLGEEVDALSESVSDIEDLIYEDEDDDDEDSFGELRMLDNDDDDDDDETTFEFSCPDCGEKLFLDEEILEAGSLKCSACGRLIEFEIVDECGCDECGCGCGHDHEEDDK